MNLAVMLLVASQAIRPGGGVTGPAVAAAGACMEASANGDCTMTQSTTYSGVTTDITSAGNEDITIDPGGGSGSGSVVFVSEDEASIFADSGGSPDLEVLTSTAGVRARIRAVGNTAGAVGLDDGTARIGTLDDRSAGNALAVACVADGITAGNTGNCLLTVRGAGEVESTQVTSGTPATWRQPTLAANSGGSAPTCVGTATAYGNFWGVDDTNDTAAAMMCWCRRGADDATLASVSIHDNSTSCITAALLGVSPFDYEIFTWGDGVMPPDAGLNNRAAYLLSDGFYADTGTLLYVRGADIVWRWHPVAWVKSWGWAVVLIAAVTSFLARILFSIIRRL